MKKYVDLMDVVVIVVACSRLDLKMQGICMPNFIEILGLGGDEWFLKLEKIHPIDILYQYLCTNEIYSRGTSR